MATKTRYPLLLYREVMNPLRIPALAMFLGMLGLCLAYFTGFLNDAGVILPAFARVLLPLALLASAAFVLAVVILPRAAYASCREEYLLLRVGLLRLIVSYARVRVARTVQHAQIHPPAEQPRARRAIAVRMARLHCVALELTSYPMAFSLLRALSHPFLFLDGTPGFVFAVRDWMGLGRELEEARAAWLGRRKDADKPRRLVEML